ncbi:hypothetical protein O7627_18695 [Solwaraspora sp. WMMD1047]|uniref:hypothetical protein n=1 Tax=Solwaraspora sp. WMMD1047 TaxID=3016102 RepID=UPI002416BDB6|nr:hypothetical protein [Solwaraspora sp. WMMD1047]MDG4831329.1 hypothetical protein [Solwaraspora sp. WMMD1047]
MRHPNDGTLRRLLDEPAGVADTDREHVAGCPRCRSGLATAQRDAMLTRAALDVEPAVDVDSAWSRLSQAAAAEGPRRQPAAPRWRATALRWRAGLRRPAVAAFAVVVLLGGASAAAAANWLQIFRTEQIAPVTLTQADLIALPDLSAYGTVEIKEPRVRGVADAATARQATGLTLPPVRKLPTGVSGEPAYQVGEQLSAVFTFSAERAAQTAAAVGEPLPPPPAGLDGSQFRLTAGPGAAAVWKGAGGAPALIVARVVAPTAYSAGIPFQTAVGYLLTLPGLPDAVAAQLRGFAGDGTTLPLPVNSRYLTSSTTDVNGRPATVLTSHDGLLAGVVWVADGVVTAVAGSLDSDEALSVARGLGQR